MPTDKEAFAKSCHSELVRTAGEDADRASALFIGGGERADKVGPIVFASQVRLVLFCLLHLSQIMYRAI